MYYDDQSPQLKVSNKDMSARRTKPLVLLTNIVIYSSQCASIYIRHIRYQTSLTLYSETIYQHFSIYSSCEGGFLESDNIIHRDARLYIYCVSVSFTESKIERVYCICYLLDLETLIPYPNYDRELFYLTI